MRRALAHAPLGSAGTPVQDEKDVSVEPIAVWGCFGV